MPQDTLGFLISQTAAIEQQAYQIRYPDIQYPQLVPVDTSASEWARTITYFSMDKTGQAAWFTGASSDVPLADVSRDKYEVTIEMAAIGYGYNLEELGQAMMIPGMNLSADRAAAARRAAEEYIDDIVLNGDSNKGWTGLINDTSVTKADAPAASGGSSRAWQDKTPDEIIKDVNDALTGVYSDSRQVEMADTMAIPVEAYTDLASRRLTDTSMTVMDYVQRANVYTAQTGQPLTIRTIRGLEDAAASSKGRMIAYRRDPQVLRLHLPMPHRFLPVWQTGPMSFVAPGIFRIGGLEIRRPGAVRYVDQITD